VLHLDMLVEAKRSHFAILAAPVNTKDQLQNSNADWHRPSGFATDELAGGGGGGRRGDRDNISVYG
jgi:hypothetical protein